MEERRLRTDDNPQALAVEASRAVAFQTSPYRYPVIGWEADIKNMSADDLRRWYDRWYGPNNAVVVVVGDVVPNEVHALAKKHFGPLAARDIPPPRSRPEVPQHGTKRMIFRSAKAKVPYLIMGFKAPVLVQAISSATVGEWEIYALDVLAETLDGDASARFQRNLVRGREIASEISASFSSSSRLTSLFSFNAVPREGTSLAELEQAILDEIEALKKDPPSAEELKRIKTQVVADTVFERDSMQHQAMIIGSLRAVGLDWRLKDTYVDAIKAVTREQVLEVAEKYLKREVLTVAYLLPEEAS
ncbi:MAG: pitrilysin family protein [Pseudomonadota bacterium]|nr:pitrilysin family protein [Pseudomonadota bacterium]